MEKKIKLLWFKCPLQKKAFWWKKPFAQWKFCKGLGKRDVTATREAWFQSISAAAWKRKKDYYLGVQGVENAFDIWKKGLIWRL